jgi:heparan-alpha-glucosaminide N-acetyltransferase
MGAMKLAATAEKSELPLQLPLRRVLAIDTLRGLTILIMIFVNTLENVDGIPEWLRHAPDDVDGMTVVDVVFPAFLFIVGMSIPLAAARRLSAEGAGWRTGRRVLTRTLGLLVLGVFTVNAEEGYNEQAMLIPIALWALLVYASAFLVWGAHRFQNMALVTALRFLGFAGLVAAGLLFRGGEDGSLRLTPQWWGILGLIGWAYLFSSAIYLLSRGRIAALTAALAGCFICYAVSRLDGVEDLPGLGWLAHTAIHTSITLCGLLTTLIFFNGERIAQRYGVALLLGLALLVLGLLLRPYYLISKNEATPSWALYSSSLCIALFAFLYWLIELRGMQAWTAFLRPAAANPLLAYLLPDIIGAAMKSLNLTLPEALTQNMTGLLWSGAYSFAMLALVAGLSRLHIKLQL